MECTDESSEKVKKNQRIIIIVFFILFLLLLSMVSIHSSGAPAGVLIGVIFTVLGLIAMIIICMFRTPETVMEDGIIRKDYSFLALERYEYYEADTWYSIRNITDEYEMEVE